MSAHRYGTLEDTLHLWFASNDTSGSGADGATPLFDVRLAGAAADAAPVLSGTPTLLTSASYPAGCYEVAIAATFANGFAAGSTYAVFCTLAVDSQNPSGFVGSFTLGPVIANVVEVGGTSFTSSPPTNAQFEARTLVAAQYATAANLSTVDTVVDAIKDVVEADEEVDKTTDANQWKLLKKHRTTGTTLLTKNLKDVNGTAITSTDTVIGQAVEPDA